MIEVLLIRRLYRILTEISASAKSYSLSVQHGPICWIACYIQANLISLKTLYYLTFRLL